MSEHGEAAEGLCPLDHGGPLHATHHLLPSHCPVYKLERFTMSIFLHANVRNPSSPAPPQSTPSAARVVEAV